VAKYLMCTVSSSADCDNVYTTKTIWASVKKTVV